MRYSNNNLTPWQDELLKQYNNKSVIFTMPRKHGKSRFFEELIKYHIENLDKERK